MIKTFYQTVRSLLPSASQIQLSKKVFSLRNRPLYDSSDFQRYDKGIVVISSDFELAWAWRYSKRKVDPFEMAGRERENIPVILNKLNELEIPITWATVGHLFLDSCVCKNGKAHIDQPRPDYFENEFWKYDKGDWYDIDTGGNYETHPALYAPDLIELILNSNVKHEIGCHSFSHIDYSETHGNKELIEEDLNACSEAARKFGVQFESFVFPGNFHGHFDILERYGYKIVRYKSNDLKDIGFTEKVSTNLFAIHDSLAIDIAEDGWDHDYVLWKLKKYVQKTIEKKAICHLWFHPSINNDQTRNILFPLLDELTQSRKLGEIEIKTMKELVQ